MTEFKRGDVVRVLKGPALGEVFTIRGIHHMKNGKPWASGDEKGFGVLLERLVLATKDVDLIRIDSQQSLKLFAFNERMRPDWHEPDEQLISARVVGDHLDNAMGATIEHNCGELNVILTREGRDYAVVNLATLFSWASRA